MSVMCQGSPLENGPYRPNGLVPPEEQKWSGFRNSYIGLGEKHCGTLRDVDSDPPVTQPQF